MSEGVSLYLEIRVSNPDTLGHLRITEGSRLGHISSEQLLKMN